MAKDYNHKHAFVLLALQLVFIVLFAAFVRYAPETDARYHSFAGSNETLYEQADQTGGHHPTYGMFQDVHVMVFIGIGFLMAYLKKYSFSATGLTLVIGVVSVQWALLINGFFHMHHGYIELDIWSILAADVIAATILISFGVVIGKTTPLQLIVMALIEVPLFVINEVIGRKYLGAVDIGDSIYLHTFAAYYGLAVTFALYRQDANTPSLGSDKTSDTFAMIGSVFLWLFWPSFNAAGAAHDDQARAVMNTYVSLAAACMTAAAVSSLVDGQRKMDMVHIQNSSLAGGVVVGATADLMMSPVGALAAGTVAGGVSVLGFTYLSPLLSSRLRLHDSAGVHNLHGIPGLISALLSVIYSALATEETYGPSLYSIFPLRAPEEGSEELERLRLISPELKASVGRSAGGQALAQLAATGVTLVFAVVGGLVTGFILRLGPLNELETHELYEDEPFWKLEEEEEDHANHSSSDLMMHKNRADHAV